MRKSSEWCATLADQGAAILLASHLLHQVQQVCDRVGIFVQGKLVASGTTDKLAATAGTGPIEIELIAAPPLDAVRQAVEKVAGVTKVVPDMRDKNMFIVTANRDVRAELARALVEAGHPAVPPAPARRRARRGLSSILRYARVGGRYRMTGQADSLPVARRRKRKNIRVQGPDAPPPRTTQRSVAKADAPHFRAGWRIIAAKEFADHISSWRFLGLTIVLALVRRGRRLSPRAA